jgi:hypothetical protein
MNKQQQKIQEKNIIPTENSSVKWQNLEVTVLKRDCSKRGNTLEYKEFPVAFITEVHGEENQKL